MRIRLARDRCDDGRPVSPSPACASGSDAVLQADRTDRTSNPMDSWKSVLLHSTSR